MTHGTEPRSFGIWALPYASVRIPKNKRDCQERDIFGKSGQGEPLLIMLLVKPNYCPGQKRRALALIASVESVILGLT
jgi:hypothetical protein